MNAQEAAKERKEELKAKIVEFTKKENNYAYTYRLSSSEEMRNYTIEEMKIAIKELVRERKIERDEETIRIVRPASKPSPMLFFPNPNEKDIW